MPNWHLFWGDTHHNSYQYPEGRAQVPPLAEVLTETARHLDFYVAAYYLPAMRHVNLLKPVDGFPGIGLEGGKAPGRPEREWAEVQAVTAAANRPGAFVVFPGYEWQGDGTWGDHNVSSPDDGLPLFQVETLPELYQALRGRRAMAIPHHIGYRPGNRAPRWEYADDTLTPFAEIYSVHGCSETDEEWIGLRRNAGMGPGTAGGTYADALNRGLRLGAIASTDNWNNVPGRYNHGLMGCLAAELTRDSLWEAFFARRVYGVTGDRIGLDFTLNGADMGAVLPAVARRRIRVAVEGEDEVDRIELLRNNRVIATHCHQGTWTLPAGRGLFKLRLEMGWGAKPGTLPWGSREWNGEVSVAGGCMRRATVYRVSPQAMAPEVRGEFVRFSLTGRQEDVTQDRQNAVLLEFEAAPGAAVTIRLNGLELRAPVADLCAGSRILGFRDEFADRLEELTGVRLAADQRADVYYQAAPKAKIHRLMPAPAWQASFEFEDDEPLAGRTHYRVRVEQRNGQRAWSSPIWIEPRAV
jgi:hypothetical protein